MSAIVKTDDHPSKGIRAKTKPAKIAISIVDDDAPARGMLIGRWVSESGIIPASSLCQRNHGTDMS
jgi:hypothetical protein